MICLNMIVKDEAKNIKRCLASVKDIVGYYVIDDTGSTDGTPELIKKLMDKYGVPGEIYHTPFQNFGYNREQNLQHAIGKGDYVLMIDADEELVCKDVSAFDNLTADCYLVEKTDNGRNFKHSLLLRIGCDWHWHGVVHNAVTSDSGESQEHFWAAHLIHHGGGSKTRGLTQREAGLKEAAILEAEMEKDPTNARNQFYLGQAYRNAGETQKAYDAYKRRMLMGGWKEEVYESMARASWCKWHLNDNEFPVGNFLSTYDFMPTRAEPLFYVAKYYRAHKAYHVAYMFAKVGIEIPYPKEAAMGIVAPIYEWMMLDEFAASAALSGHYAEAIEACDRLLAEGKLPKADIKRVKDNKKQASKLEKK